MLPQADWTAVAVGLVVGMAPGAIVLGLLTRRHRAAVGEIQARLDALAGRVARLEARDDAPVSRMTGAPAAASPPSAVAPPPAPRRRAERGAPAAVAGPTLIAVPNLAAPASGHLAESVMTTASAELGRRFGSIWELADTGSSAEAIARATNYPIGQVELILGLRRQLAATGATAEPARSGGPSEP